MPRELASILTVIYIGAAAGASAAHAQTPSRVGSEIQVNTHTPERQDTPSVAIDGSGRFVVVWQSRGQDGDDYGVFARRFDSGGMGLGTEFQVNERTTDRQRVPAVAVEANGDFVVVWDSENQDGDAFGIFGRRFASNGTPLTGELQVNTFTPGFQLAPAVAMDADGDFVVAWGSNGQDAATYGVFAQRFDSSGSAVGAELKVNVFTANAQKFPSVGMDADGDFVVAWVSQNQDGEHYGVFGRRFSSAGAGVGGELQINTYTTLIQSTPAVAVDADSDFVVAWLSAPQDGDTGGIFARRFSSSGAGLGSELQVNLVTASNQQAPAIAIAADGDFVIAWQSTNGDGLGGDGIVARSFSATGASLGGEFVANPTTAGNQRAPGVAVGAEGRFVVVWQSYDQDGDYSGVFAQRFSPIGTLDVDGNGAVTALTDGLLFLRFAFSLTGTSLTSGAVGAGCTRCDAASILPYLGGLGLQMDIDGNGAVQPLADGLLVLRFLFGLTDTSLTGSAVGMGCTRCDAAAILPYLQAL